MNVNANLPAGVSLRDVDPPDNSEAVEEAVNDLSAFDLEELLRRHNRFYEGESLSDLRESAINAVRDGTIDEQEVL